MPLPDKKKNESKKAFVSRCMSNPQTKKDSPDQKQRTAVCFSRAARAEVQFTDLELEAMATAFPFGNRSGEVGQVPKKKKMKKDMFRLVNDDEAGSSVTVTDEDDDKKKKKPKKSTKEKKGSSY